MRTTATLVRRIWLVGVKMDMAAARRPGRAAEAHPRRPPEDHQRSLWRPGPRGSPHPADLLRRRRVCRKSGEEKGATTPARCGFYDVVPQRTSEALFLHVIPFRQ